MKYIIKTILGYLLIPICKVLNKIIKFRFYHMYSSRIGHLTMQFDTVYKLVERDTFILVSTEKKVANNFILNLYKRQERVLISQIFRYCFSLIRHVNPKSEFIITLDEYDPPFSFNLHKNSLIKFPNYSEAKLEKIFSNYNLNRNFVGLHARNDLYLKNESLLNQDKNSHVSRNMDFKDYLLAIKYLKKKYSIVKLGKTYDEETPKTFEDKFGSKIFTSQDFNNNQEIDYLLNVYSKYNIMTASGLDKLSAIIKKNIVYVNFIPFNLGNLSYSSPNSIVIPKKIFDKNKGRLLSFRENLSINFSIHTSECPYKKNNLEVINNTPEEILNIVIEMEEKLAGNNQDDQKKINEIFWKNITDENNYDKINYLKDKLKLSVSSSFLKNNQNLF